MGHRDSGDIAQQRIARRIRVYGQVQGVFFRVSTRDESLRLGLAGFVRNCRDGSVEALFEGPPEAVHYVLDFCKRGPPGARVDRTEVAEEAVQNRGGFLIER